MAFCGQLQCLPRPCFYIGSAVRGGGWPGKPKRDPNRPVRIDLKVDFVGRGGASLRPMPWVAGWQSPPGSVFFYAPHGHGWGRTLGRCTQTHFRALKKAKPAARATGHEARLTNYFTRISRGFHETNFQKNNPAFDEFHEDFTRDLYGTLFSRVSREIVPRV